MLYREFSRRDIPKFTGRSSRTRASVNLEETGEWNRAVINSDEISLATFFSTLEFL